MTPFHIKICGVTCVADAETVAAAGADAVGLNFFPGSKRCVPLEMAAAISRALPADVRRVGLFVNADSREVRKVAKQLSLDVIQLHGDEPPELLAELGDWPIVRAFCTSPDWQTAVDHYLDRCGELHALPAAVLMDAYRPGAYGGTGAQAEWEEIVRWSAERTELPIVLAGGLTPDNVSAAIEAVHPAAVDTASGVESSPGIKDAGLVRQFVAAARNLLTM